MAHRLEDIAYMIDDNLPVWINEDGNAERYDSIADAIEEYGQYIVQYITTDGENELTIDVYK